MSTITDQLPQEISKNALKRQAAKEKKRLEMEYQKRIEAQNAAAKQNAERKEELKNLMKKKINKLETQRTVTGPQKDAQGNVLSKKEINKQKHEMMSKGLEKMLADLGIEDKECVGQIKNKVKSGTLKNSQDIMDYVTQLVTSRNVAVQPGSFGDQMRTMAAKKKPEDEDGEEVVVVNQRDRYKQMENKLYDLGLNDINVLIQVQDALLSNKLNNEEQVVAFVTERVKTDESITVEKDSYFYNQRHALARPMLDDIQMDD